MTDRLAEGRRLADEIAQAVDQQGPEMGGATALEIYAQQLLHASDPSTFDAAFDHIAAEKSAGAIRFVLQLLPSHPRSGGAVAARLLENHWERLAQLPDPTRIDGSSLLNSTIQFLAGAPREPGLAPTLLDRLATTAEGQPWARMLAVATDPDKFADQIEAVLDQAESSGSFDEAVRGLLRGASRSATDTLVLRLAALPAERRARVAGVVESLAESVAALRSQIRSNPAMLAKLNARMRKTLEETDPYAGYAGIIRGA